MILRFCFRIKMAYADRNFEGCASSRSKRLLKKFRKDSIPGRFVSLRDAASKQRCRKTSSEDKTIRRKESRFELDNIGSKGCAMSPSMAERREISSSTILLGKHNLVFQTQRSHGEICRDTASKKLSTRVSRGWHLRNRSCVSLALSRSARWASSGLVGASNGNASRIRGFSSDARAKFLPSSCRMDLNFNF